MINISIFIVFHSVHPLPATCYHTFNLIDRNHSDVTVRFLTYSSRSDNVFNYHKMLYYVSEVLYNVDRTYVLTITFTTAKTSLSDFWPIVQDQPNLMDG
jgi:hypothetical protein